MNIDTQEVREGIYPRPLGFGKGLRGKIGNAVSGSQLTILETGRTLGRSKLALQFPDEAAIQDFSDEEFAELNVGFPRLAAVLLSTNRRPREDFYLEGIPADSAAGALPIFLDLHCLGRNETEDHDRPVLRVVFGATEEMPLRSLSYMLPALLHMQALMDEAGSKTPQLQVVFAKHVSGQLNGLNAGRVAKQALRFAKAADVFIEMFFPLLRNRVLFLEDRGLQNEAYRDSLLTVEREMRGRVNMEELSAKAATRRSERTASFYSAAHVLFHETSAHDLLTGLANEQGAAVFPQQPVPLPATAIINYGGIQEQPFYRLRQEARRFVSLPLVPTLQYYTAHHVPPYFMAQGQSGEMRDMSLDAALSSGGRLEDVLSLLPRAAREDLVFLNQIMRDRSATYGDGDPLGPFLAASRDRLMAM